MKNLLSISDGFACIANGSGPDFWNALVLLRPEPDQKYFHQLDMNRFEPKSPDAVIDWRKAVPVTQAELRLITGRKGAIENVPVQTTTGTVCGFQVTGSEKPVAVWIESDREMKIDKLMVYENGNAREVYASSRVLNNPVVLGEPGNLAIFCSTRKNRKELCLCLDSQGSVIRELPGRNPVALELPGNRIALIVEQVRPDNSVVLTLYSMGKGDISEYAVPSIMEQNTNANAVFDAECNQIYLTFETFPLWGCNELQGQFRDLALFSFSLAENRWTPGPGTGNGVLPLPQKAFFDTSSSMNLVPLNPKVQMLGTAPAITFQQFRFIGGKGFGWDLLLTRLQQQYWTDPVQLNHHRLLPDTGYAVFADNSRCVCITPSCDHECQKTFAEAASGHPGRSTQPVRNQRVEIFSVHPDKAGKPCGFPASFNSVYQVPPSIPAIAPEPPAGVVAPGKFLIWGDIHSHCIYSKCISACDGFPIDVLRFQRDFLGCRVLCLSDHVEYMNCAEFHHVMDRIEAEAGHDCIPLYGVEWAKNPAHHTNFYAVDRDIFGILRTILQEESHLTPIYDRIRKELPKGTVAVHRHMHGRNTDEFGTRGSRVTASFDPEMEHAMEAMQSRGNMMWPGANAVPFPTHFLNAGARIGLVGGSDHSRGFGPNHFCLTGFIVDEISPQGIFQAMLQRRTIAVANGKIAIRATIGNAEIGDVVNHSGPVSFRVGISSAFPLEKVCLIRNGIFLEWMKLEENRAEIELTDPVPPQGPNWYSVTVCAGSAYRGPGSVAHTSPIFVE